MVLPNLPAQGQDPWYTERTAFDNAVSGSIENLEATTELINPRTIFVPAYALPGDASLSQSFRRAFDDAKSLGVPTVIQLPAGVVEFNERVDMTGSFTNLTIQGYGVGVTEIRVKAGAGDLTAAFLIPAAAGGVIQNLTFQDFTINGGMISAPAGFARDERVFGPDSIVTGIAIAGDRTPTATSASAKVSGITTRRVNVYGTKGLPMLFQGISDLITDDCRFERTLDYGVTFTDGVRLTNCDSYWSGDNGFSLSRGCTNVVATGNKVFGCHRWAYWVSGFGTDAGPEGFTLTGNEAEMCGWGGITADLGAKNGTIVGNSISDVRRGALGTSNFGIGIYVSGLSSTNWAENIVIAGNVLTDCQRGGILVRAYSRGVVVSSNLTVRPGTANDELGNVIAATDMYQNFGVSVIGAAASITESFISGNFAYDNRPTKLMNFTEIVFADVRPGVQQAGGSGFGARTIRDEFWQVGTDESTSAVMRLNGPSSGSKNLQFTTAGNLRAALRVVDSLGIYGSTYNDAGAVTNHFRMTRGNPAFEHLTPVKLPEYTTAGRPSAVTYPGSIIRDTTLNKAILSNGTVWTNVDGTAL